MFDNGSFRRRRKRFKRPNGTWNYNLHIRSISVVRSVVVVIPKVKVHCLFRYTFCFRFTLFGHKIRKTTQARVAVIGPGVSWGPTNQSITRLCPGDAVP